MASETVTPNIALQIADYNQTNWQVPTNYNWNLLDLIFGGLVTVPALNVTTLTAGNAGGFTLPPASNETPVGAIPGTVYTLLHAPSPAAMLQFTYNGTVLRQGIDYTLTSNIVTLSFTTTLGDTVYATYFYSA